MQMFLEADVDTSILAEEKVAILGYGSQGRAHALNLKDSGFNVVVGLRKDGASWPKAEADGLTVQEPRDAVAGAAAVMFLTPDMVQKALYNSVSDAIPQGALLLALAPEGRVTPAGTTSPLGSRVRSSARTAGMSSRAATKSE